MARDLKHLASDELRKTAYDERVTAMQASLINDPIKYCPICGMMEVDRDLRSLEPYVYGCYMCGWKIQIKPKQATRKDNPLIFIPETGVSLFKFCPICGYSPIKCGSALNSLYQCKNKSCRRTTQLALIERSGMGLIGVKRSDS